MERAKLKLTVIFLLALLNVFLLGQVIFQQVRTGAYEAASQDQAVAYLEDRHIAVEADVIPWESVFADSKADPRAQLFSWPEDLSVDSPVNTWEILSPRKPETLVVDFHRAMTDRGVTYTQITAIWEGYDGAVLDSLVVLTPVWEVETDLGLYRLNCATGELL